jgi:hypothetical protein
LYSFYIIIFQSYSRQNILTGVLSMTKKTLLVASLVATIAFSGCMGTDPAPTTAKATTSVDKVATVAKEATTTATTTVDKATAVIDAPPAQSTLSDQAVDKAIEVADKHTDGAATKVIESVQ